MKKYNVTILSISISLFSPAAYADTGTYCNEAQNEFVSYYCGAQQPPGFPARDGNGCTARVKAQCSAIPFRNGVFDYDAYGQRNGDVAVAGVNRADHWRDYGRAEGRPSSFSFFIREYLSRNGDLSAAFGTNWLAGLDHYSKYGLHEGRITVDGDLNAPNIPVFVHNPNYFDPIIPDGQYRLSVQRVGSQGSYPANQISVQTHMDTTDYTGLPNAFRNGEGVNIKGAPNQFLVDSEIGFYGVQQYAGQIGIGIDTRAIKPALNEWGTWAVNNGVSERGLGTIVINKSFRSNSLNIDPGMIPAPFPWRNNGVWKSEQGIRIPRAGGAGPRGAQSNGSQVVSYLFIRDNSPGCGGSLALGVNLFDTRSNAFDDILINRVGEFNLFNVPLKRGNPNVGFLTISPFSAEATTSTYNENRFYSWTITRNNLAAIISRAGNTFQGLCQNLDNYEVLAFVFNPETFSDYDAAGNFTGDGWLGMSLTLGTNGPTAN